jgi:hypothetical protein
VLPKDLEYIMPSAYKNSVKCSFIWTWDNWNSNSWFLTIDI